MKYLHNEPEGSHNYWLDHRLVPEVRAMLAAMSSRMPIGGVCARYQQLLDVVESEERLTEYPLHPRVQKFFDDFVGQYGHSSILELSGEPCVFSEQVSYLTAWLLFDSPLCSGQEFSTRAVQHKNWPMAQECYPTQGSILSCCPGQHTHDPHPMLKQIHDGWLEIYEAEVAWWTEHLSVPENRQALGIADKEAFRPALDRARWALPGTIATGCAHTSNLRERARVLSVGQAFSAGSGAGAEGVWSNLHQTYKAALPGMAQYGLREAVYGETTAQVPYHLSPAQFLAPEIDALSQQQVKLDISYSRTPSTHLPVRESSTSYADPIYNQIARVAVRIDCSLAVARDWHRHRTLYPFTLYLRLNQDAGLQIDSHYQPMSDLGRRQVSRMLDLSTAVYNEFQEAGQFALAPLCLPLGAAVRLHGAGGLRDVLYTLELRSQGGGACFEYKEQAQAGLNLLRGKLTSNIVAALKI